MNRIIKVVAIALLVLMAFPLVVAADEPPPPEGPSIESPLLVPLEGLEGFEFAPLEGPSIEAPMLVPNEGFEGFQFPPSGWSVKRTNANLTWMQIGMPLVAYSGMEAAYVAPDASPQDEVLLTPKFYAPYVYVRFASITSSVDLCTAPDDKCNLEVWVVRGAWGPGGGNDIPLYLVDGDWTTDGVWVRTAFLLTLEPTITKPIRLGFRYLGAGDGAVVGLDDVSIVAVRLNKNYSFELGGTKFGWTGQNLTTKDKRDSSEQVSGAYSFKMVGSSAKKSLIQTMNYSGHMYDPFVVSGWSMSQNAKAGQAGHPYQVVVTVHHLDGSTESHKIKFSSGSHGWEYKSAGFLTKEPYNRIDLEIRYWNQGGKAWFDAVMLVY